MESKKKTKRYCKVYRESIYLPQSQRLCKIVNNVNDLVEEVKKVAKKSINNKEKI